MNTTLKPFTTEDLKALQSRLSLHQPGTVSALAPFFDKCLQAMNSQDAARKRSDLLTRAFRDGDRDALRAYNELKVLTINNFVTAMANAMTFFNTVTLTASQVPVYVNKTGQETGVRFIGRSGLPGKRQAVKEQSQVAVDLRTISSDPVEIPIRDVNTGLVYDQTAANYNQAYDIGMKINAELWKLVDASTGAFNLTGAREKRTLHLHSSINPANLPSGNRIVLAGNTTSTKFRFDAIRAIVQWAMGFGTNALSTGEVIPLTIFAPSSDVGAMLDEIDIDSPDNSLVEQITTFGHVVSVGGKRINIVGDATLDPAQGACYVKMNRPLGDVFSKPELDQSFPSSASAITDQDRKDNHVALSQQKVYAAVVPEPQRIGAAKVVYRTPE